MTIRHAYLTANHNIYTEGYTLESTHWMIVDENLETKNRLPKGRRCSDPRYSLRVEARLLLYGYELGGDEYFSVAETGFVSYVKTYKPWFIGRTVYILQQRKKKREVIGLIFTDRSVRMAHQEDPAHDRRGKVIGEVTSCSTNGEGNSLGQARVEEKFTEEEMQLLIYQGASEIANKAPASMVSGDRVTIPNEAKVIRRYPK